MGSGSYYHFMRNTYRGGEGETARRPASQSVSQSGRETDLGLDLPAPDLEFQPHPGEQGGNNWLSKNGGKSVKREEGGGYI